MEMIKNIRKNSGVASFYAMASLIFYLFIALSFIYALAELNWFSGLPPILFLILTGVAFVGSSVCAVVAVSIDKGNKLGWLMCMLIVFLSAAGFITDKTIPDL